MIDNPNTEKAATSILDTIKNSTLLGDTITKLKESKDVLFWGLFYGGIGFLAGFFFKHYNRALLLFFLFVGILIVLHLAGFLSIAINGEKITQIFGIQTSATNHEMTSLFCEWMRNNIYIAITLMVGFVLGVSAS